MKSLRVHYRNLFFCVALVSCIGAIIILSCTKKQSDTLPISQNYPAELKEDPISKNSVNSPLLRKQKNDGEYTFNRKYFQKLTQEEKCPACFGYDICEEINASFIKLTSTTPLSIKLSPYRIYEGKLGNLQKVSIKVPQLTAEFDQLVCSHDIDSPEKCRFLSSLESFLPFHASSYSSIINSRSSLGILPHQLPLLMCQSTKLEEITTEAFDINEDKILNDYEQKVLYSSFVLAPDIVAVKVISKIGLGSSFARLVGTCGRVAVFESGLMPLSLFLDKPFTQRVSLAAQLLSIIQSFAEANSEWTLIQTSWSFDDFSVNEQGEVVFNSAVGMIIAPKSSKEESKTCGKGCVKELHERLFSSIQPGNASCFTQEEASHAMLASLCLMILSDMTQHKFNDYYFKSSSEKSKHRSQPGLLHSPPEEEKKDIEKFLTMCVDETLPGERVTAIEDLQDLLSDIIEEEQVDYDDDNEDEDDDGDGDDEQKEEGEGDDEEKNNEQSAKKLDNAEQPQLVIKKTEA